MSDYVLKLNKLNQAHGQAITSLTFRAPTGKDIFEAGYPYKFQTDSRSPGLVTRIIDVPSTRTLLAKLASVPHHTIDNLSFAEFNNAIAIISYFLVEPTLSSSSNTALRSESSGEMSSGVSV